MPRQTQANGIDPCRLTCLSLTHCHQGELGAPLPPNAPPDTHTRQLTRLLCTCPAGLTSWEMIVDGDDVYYYNHGTKSSSWDRPRMQPVDLPSGWRRHLDAEGDVFYFNENTVCIIRSFWFGRAPPVVIWLIAASNPPSNPTAYTG